MLAKMKTSCATVLSKAGERPIFPLITVPEPERGGKMGTCRLFNLYRISCGCQGESGASDL